MKKRSANTHTPDRVPETMPQMLIDLEETANRLRGLSQRMMSDRRMDMIDVMLISKAAGYLRGLKKFLQQNEVRSEPIITSKPLNLTDM